ncbi:MAG: hypothetical protein ACM31C_05275 [Acidobacteriota bacterium]
MPEPLPEPLRSRSWLRFRSFVLRVRMSLLRAAPLVVASVVPGVVVEGGSVVVVGGGSVVGGGGVGAVVVLPRVPGIVGLWPGPVVELAEPVVFDVLLPVASVLFRRQPNAAAAITNAEIAERLSMTNLPYVPGRSKDRARRV